MHELKLTLQNSFSSQFVSKSVLNYMFMLLEFGKKEHFVLDWWIALYGLPDIHPASLSLPPLHRTVRGRKQDEKSLRLSERQRDHLPIAIRCQTDPRKINLIYCRLKLELNGEKQIQELKHFPSSCPSFTGSVSFLHSQLLYLLPAVSSTGGCRVGLWSVHKSSTLLFLPPHNSPCFSAGSLHGLQSFQNRYCVGPLDGLQALRISLLQHWSFTGCSSFRTWPPALAWSPQQAAEWKTAPSQVPSMGCRGNFCYGA